MAKPFCCDLKPLRNIKNRFHPLTKHGRDTGYGEYAVYALLGASLFARVHLVADDSIAEAPAPVGSTGTQLHLYPEFHRTFASCGDTQVQIDTKARLAHDASYITARGEAGRAAAIAPAWRKGDGPWQSLAACSDEITNVRCGAIRIADDAVKWRLTHDLAGLAVKRVAQTFALTPGRLEMDVDVEGRVDAVALEVPLLTFDGEREAKHTIGQTEALVEFRGATFAVNVPDATRVRVDDIERASREAVYRVAAFAAAGKRVRAELRLSCSQVTRE